MAREFVSLLMLTHNAPDYVRTSIDTIRAMTRDVGYELVVVDNASGIETVDLVQDYASKAMIDRLIVSRENTYFAGGNNIAARAASQSASHFLLINSDIEIRDPGWLRRLLDVHKPGITAYGIVPGPVRVDGYCLLIDAPLYRERQLSETHQWWWGVTKLQAELMCDGYSVQGYAAHEAYLHHFGGKSGQSFKDANGMDVSVREVTGWFKGHVPTILDRNRYRAMRTLSLGTRGLRKVKRMFGS